ncbi:MAG: hypothetical protein N2044_09385 [Cyclobacteriaceae bacterium]|nr:hypothetical protein [Cyclobacteriaceae bacterium]MCX7638040.1 hypothetical protein [Cyclobacteriaceae bacterium]MDW8332114.1 hypothetical protein [Cyclobacteriaceae bacterium]
MKSAGRIHVNPISRDLLLIAVGTFVAAVTLVTLAVIALHQL